MSKDTSSRFEELDSTPLASTSSLPLPPSSQNSKNSKTTNTTLEKEQEKKKKAKKSSDTDGEEGGDDEEYDEEDSVWWTPSELREILDRSTALKVAGNSYFAKGDYDTALITYRDGLVELPMRSRVKLLKKGKGKGNTNNEGDLLDELTGRVGELSVLEGAKVDSEPDEDVDETEGEGESTELTELRSILFANVAACLIKLNKWKEAVTACDDALEDNPRYVKALHRRAMASESIGSWSSLTSALEDYKTLASLPGIAPSLLSTIKQGERRLPDLITIQQKKETDEVMNKLKEMGNSVLNKFGFSTDNFKFTQQEGGGYSMNFER